MNLHAQVSHININIFLRLTGIAITLALTRILLRLCLMGQSRPPSLRARPAGNATPTEIFAEAHLEVSPNVDHLNSAEHHTVRVPSFLMFLQSGLMSNRSRQAWSYSQCSCYCHSLCCSADKQGMTRIAPSIEREFFTQYGYTAVILSWRHCWSMPSTRRMKF